MMHNYRINCNALMQNNLFREVEIMSYVNGKSKLVKTRADIETFCLYDFLIFLSNAKSRKIIIQDNIQYSWINYPYLIEKNPTLFLNNAKIKRMLSILEKLELLKIINDGGSIYVSIRNLELVMLSNDQSVMNHNQGSVMNHNQGSVMNHNCNNNKESIIQKNQECFIPPTPQRESESEKAHTSKASEYTEEFEKFWSEYPRKLNKKLAFKAWNTCLKAKVNAELLISKAKEYAQIVKARGTQEQYIKHAQSWLNGGCYENDYTALLNQQDKQRQAVMQRGLSDWGSNDDDGFF